MKKTKRLLVAIIVIASTFFILKGCQVYSKYSRPPKITVINNSKLELKDVTLLGAGFTKKIGNLDPQGSLSTEVQPRGESGLKISFTAKSENYQKDDLAYIESTGGYIVQITIDESLNIKSECSMASLKFK
ncbi:MAG: hypothetical protein ABII88_10980 [Candidatus Omnitrophota bacterium]